jgi:hypothetical protein
MSASDHKTSDNLESKPCFSIPLPGGKVARIPQDVVEKYVSEDASATHGPAPSTPEASASGGQPQTTTIHAGESMITINIYAGQGEVAVDPHATEDDDVVAHSLSVDATTGTSEWHTDWEFGECEYTDETGFPQRIQAWHRHPFGTEYSEIYDG